MSNQEPELEGVEGSGRFSEANDPYLQRIGICHSCRHNRGMGKCAAYPEGIPVDILVGNEIHTHPLPGDNGIQYEAIVL